MGDLELKWINEHSDEISRHGGKWIALYKNDGIISVNDNLDMVVKEFKKKYPTEMPCVFKVPREDEEIIAL